MTSLKGIFAICACLQISAILFAKTLKALFLRFVWDFFVVVQNPVGSLRTNLQGKGIYLYNRGEISHTDRSSPKQSRAFSNVCLKRNSCSIQINK